jgi:exodeoxyribonuclease-5
MATDVREGRPLVLGQYGDGSAVIPRGEATEALAQPDVQVLCGKNATRHGWNAAIRRKRGFTGLLNPGETLVCLRNDYDLSMWNGALYTVQACGEEYCGRIPVTLCAEGEIDRIETEILVADLFGRGMEVMHNDRYDSAEMNYGYVLTTHKSQGSQWPNVAVLDESSVFKGQKDRWLYTAITRAEKTVTVVR